MVDGDQHRADDDREAEATTYRGGLESDAEPFGS